MRPLGLIDRREEQLGAAGVTKRVMCGIQGLWGSWPRMKTKSRLGGLRSGLWERKAQPGKGGVGEAPKNGE